jgi:hypothetical protein
MAMTNILIVVMQSFRYNTEYMKQYELGQKPVNSVWINYYHLKKYLIAKKIGYYPINLNSDEKIGKAVRGRKYDSCITIFNDPNGWKDGVNHMPMLIKLRDILKCPFFLFTEVLDEIKYANWINYFDMIFTNREEKYDKVISVGFAANHELLVPNKDPKILQILVDHPAYSPDHFKKRDRTKDILEQIFVHTFPKGKEVVVRRFVNGAVETVDPQKYSVELYNRKGINILNAFDEYNKADIFFVTHPESMGLSVVESAMSGALIVTPKFYIKPEFLAGLEHIEFDKQIDWSIIMAKLDAKICRRKALKKTWTCLFDLMFTHINKFIK